MANIPSINPFLCGGDSILDVSNRYLTFLQEDDSSEFLLDSVKQQEVLSMLLDVDSLRKFLSIFDEPCQTDSENCPRFFNCSNFRTLEKTKPFTERKCSLDTWCDLCFCLTVWNSASEKSIESRYPQDSSFTANYIRFSKPNGYQPLYFSLSNPLNSRFSR